MVPWSAAPYTVERGSDGYTLGGAGLVARIHKDNIICQAGKLYPGRSAGCSQISLISNFCEICDYPLEGLCSMRVYARW